MEHRDSPMVSSPGEESWVEALGRGSAEMRPTPLTVGDTSRPYQAILSMTDGQRMMPRGSLVGVAPLLPPRAS